ncbi:hypothetical protein ACFFSY_27395 [Paenibacillus aurantiacus]|uniref:Flagellar hook-length control protein FliK n=1 Tax=Paenibacillus aurantiacus TaxID=1936118 RepID=A0ABV5KWT5_9BACL
MNIGQVMRGLVGDVQQGEGKALELKAGQVVRGVVLQTMDDNEALIQIGSSQVRAKLETSLAPGQSAMFQVQPQTDNGPIVMKTVDAQTATPSDETVKEWVKSLGLPETKWAGELVRDLRRSGITLNKQVIGQFLQAAEMKPAKVDMQSWMQTAAVAVKRGLPMTETTMNSLHQALSGPPVHELLQKLESGLAQFLGPAQNSDGGSGSPTQAAAARVAQLLAEGADLMQLPEESESSTTRGGKSGVVTQSVGAGESMPQKMEPPDERAGSKSAQPAPVPVSAQGDGRVARQADVSTTTRNQLGGALGQLMKWFGVDHERLLAQAVRDEQPIVEAGTDNLEQAENTRQGARTAEQQRTPQQVAQAAQTPLLARGQEIAAAAHTSQLTASTASQQSTTPAAAASTSPQGAEARPSTPVDSQQGAQAARVTLPSQQGSAATPVDQSPQSHKQAQAQEAVKPADNTTDQAGKVPGTGLPDRSGGSGLTERAAFAQGQLTQTADMISAGARAESSSPADNMKHALMSLAGSDDVPPALKETAQQLIQQITGQQLLLSPERNGSPFTHVTMFIPLKTANGDQTASIHIQTRRGRKGELDADNCRLMFDLRMKSLGDTIVDVQVVDKIVSLRLWNDHPAIESLLDGSRSEITEALKQAGYQLSSLRATPLPDRLAFASDTPSAVAPSPVQTAYASKPYKGVDYRA